jgi:hypothetical protein
MTKTGDLKIKVGIEEFDTVERLVFRETDRVATWPEDPKDQRMWAFSQVKGGYGVSDAEDLEKVIAASEIIIRYINDGAFLSDRDD